MQNLTIVGNLGDDAQVADMPSGNSQVINFSLAVTEKVKDEKVTTWYRCAYFTNNVAIAPWLTKGSLIGVSGKPSIETYVSNTGETKANLKCFVRDIKLYSSTKVRDAAPQQQQAPQNNQHQNAPNNQEEHDDLPF
jgi:single-strand DNA-binding protein